MDYAWHVMRSRDAYVIMPTEPVHEMNRVPKYQVRVVECAPRVLVKPERPRTQPDESSKTSKHQGILELNILRK